MLNVRARQAALSVTGGVTSKQKAILFNSSRDVMRGIKWNSPPQLKEEARNSC